MKEVNCTNCNKIIFLAESPEEQRIPCAVKYWSYDDKGEKMPYCDAACSLEYHTKNIINNKK